MINCTKILTGKATVSDKIRSEGRYPLVVWNMTCKCNLNCIHCYIDACEHGRGKEFTTDEAKAMIEDLASINVPVLLFSGGEPLVRKDIFELGRFAAGLGIRPAISTNGTLINAETAKKIKDAGFQYVGVSIDGSERTHDKFRNKEGAFAAALEGLRRCKEAGIKAGVRFTVNKLNIQDLPGILELLEKEEIPRFCLYHLVYAGRAADIVEEDVSEDEARWVIDTLIEKILDWNRREINVEVLTTDNHADGIYLRRYIKENQPERLEEVKDILLAHGGCSAGYKFSNIDPYGDVHPCQFWQHYTLGNIREKKFSEIWHDSSNEFLKRLRNLQNNIQGKCAECEEKKFCGGCRIRAEAVNGNIWAEDPACYLQVQSS